jgi:predicted GIY-YIG superfamily endonuclease
MATQEIILHSLGMPRKPRGVYYCYMLVSLKKGQRTYIGYSSDPYRRLREHNGEIQGGARSTKGWRPFRLVCIVGKFSTRGEAMSFEYHWKHNSARVSGRMNRVRKLLQDPEWVGKTVKIVAGTRPIVV